MVRLVKGAYWDSEIKRAQVDGLDGFPGLHPQGPHRRLLSRLRAQAARRARRGLPAIRHPQRADARLGASSFAGPNFYRGQYEFQCLHGMGEPLYEEVVGRDKLDRPVPHLRAGRHARDAARLSGAPPAGERRQHLVRQPHRRPDRRRSTTLSPIRSRSRAPSSRSARRIRRIARRGDSTGRSGRNSRGLDLARRSGAGRARRRRCAQAPRRLWRAAADAPDAPAGAAGASIPPTTRDVVGHVRDRRRRRRSRRRSACAEAGVAAWAATPPVGARGLPAPRRRRCSRRAMPSLIGLIVREAGKSYANAVAEVREAVDFLRYYAAEAARTARRRTRRRRSGRSSASAPGTSRSRSSPARSPRRSRPATRCSPSRPRRRR